MEKASNSHGASGLSINYLNLGEIYCEGVGGGSSENSPSFRATTMRIVRRVRRLAPRCQVEGCGVDLSDAKSYYSRHKVCEIHSKSPMLIVGGMEQKFCQQCCKFHLLSEFDQGKRSCRKRLAIRRERRKNPPPPLQSSSFHGRSSRFRGFITDFSQPMPEVWPTPEADIQSPTHQWATNELAPHGGYLDLQSSLCGDFFSAIETSPGHHEDIDHLKETGLGRAIEADNTGMPGNQRGGEYMDLEPSTSFGQTNDTTHSSL